MKSNIKIAVMILATVICIILTALIASNVSAGTKESNSRDKESATFPASQTYVVKDYGGKVAVFSASASYPIEVYDTDTDSLPENDKKYLSKGIYAKDEEELETIIEDLTS